MIISLTGHRPNKLGNDYDLTSPLTLKIKAKLQEIINKHKPERIITGMALGMDTLWALLAIENNIPFTAAIPCLNQESRWPERSKRLYNDIINHRLCTKKYISSDKYDNECMQRRNIWMVDNSDILVAVWDGSSGGTGNCVEYAKDNTWDIIWINPKKL